MKQKIQNLQRKLAQGLIGRETAINTALLSLVAGENILLIGPPGTGKSMISRKMSQAIAPQAEIPAYFEYLLTKFSTPEELFGPLSISSLKQDKFERQTHGYLPSVQVAFLDEIFKASSSILNSLLTILNERKFHNGVVSQRIPLQTLVAASNELPNGQAELSALYDRFLLRCFVGYLDSHQLNALCDLPESVDVADDEKLDSDFLQKVRQAASQVQISPDMRQILLNIWQAHATLFKDDADEQLSDRRFVKIVHLLRVSAATNERNQVDLSDLVLLKDCLWNNDANRRKVAKLVLNELKKHDKNIIANPNAQPIQKQYEPEIIEYDYRCVDRKYIDSGKGNGSKAEPFRIDNYNFISLIDLASDKFNFIIEDNIEYRVLMNRHRGRLAMSAFMAAGGGIGINQLNQKTQIYFQGHIMGNNKTITQHGQEFLFDEIKDSYIKNLHLKGMMFAKKITNSILENCSSDTGMIAKSTHNTKLINCSGSVKKETFDVVSANEMTTLLVSLCEKNIWCNHIG